MPRSRSPETLVPRLRSGPKPLVRQLLDILERHIADGALSPGARLPPERTLALRAGVSRNTVVAAYRDLEARGLVRAHVGRGTFVCAAAEGGAPFAWRGKVAEAARRVSDAPIRDLIQAGSVPAVISFGPGVPALDAFPTREFDRLVHRVLTRDATLAWRHAPTEGLPLLRSAIASRFGLRDRSVLVLSGAQQGLDLVARCLVDPGDTVVIDRPGYLGAIQVFRAAGARVVGWDFVRERLDELEDLFLRYRPKLLYTNPSFQNPTGHTLSLPSRRDLLNLAVRYRVPVIEDGTYQELGFGDPPAAPLVHLDQHDVVIHLNTFSKMLAPGLRLGWIAAAPAIVEQLTLIKQRSDPHTQNLVQEVVGGLIEEGVLDAHLAVLRRTHRQRWNALEAAVRRHVPRGEIRLGVPRGGLYSWARLGRRHHAREVSARARLAGVAVVSGDVFYPDEGGASELRICFSTVTPEQCEQGVVRLAGCLATPSAVMASVRIV